MFSGRRVPVEVVAAIFVLWVALTVSVQNCAKAPPNLSPAGQAAFQKTRVIKGLDLLRDFAIDGEAATPQIIPTKTARAIVQAHQSTLKIMDAAGAGWQTLVGTSLDQLLANLPPADAAKVQPYVALVKALLAEVP